MAKPPGFPPILAPMECPMCEGDGEVTAERIREYRNVVLDEAIAAIKGADKSCYQGEINTPYRYAIRVVQELKAPEGKHDQNGQS